MASNGSGRPPTEISVTPSTFARMCHTSRQAIYSAANRKKITRKGGMISLENKKNIIYLNNHGGSIENYFAEEAKKATNKNGSKKSATKGNGTNNNNGAGKERDKEYFEFSVERRVLEERHRKLLIENDKAMGELVEKTLFQSIFAELGQAIQVAFVDLPRREAPTLAAIAGAIDKERDIEHYLRDRIQVAIISVVSKIEAIAAGEGLE